MRKVRKLFVIVGALVTGGLGLTVISVAPESAEGLIMLN
jgi:uncharacterized membrane protein YuzA (DUF378 family)